MWSFRYRSRSLQVLVTSPPPKGPANVDVRDDAFRREHEVLGGKQPTLVRVDDVDPAVIAVSVGEAGDVEFAVLDGLQLSDGHRVAEPGRLVLGDVLVLVERQTREIRCDVAGPRTDRAK